MRIKVARSTVRGGFAVPGSKSHTIRAVAFGAVARGVSEIRNPLVSGDSLSSLNGAAALGAGVEMLDGLWKVRGNGGIMPSSGKAVDMGNSGTSLRIFSALAALAPAEFSFDGDDSLRTRVMAPLLSAFEQMGASVKSRGGFCPISVKGPVRGGRVEIECRSSQFLSALLVSLPLAAGASEISVTLLNEVPYVEITLDWLDRMSAICERTEDLRRFRIPGRQKYDSFAFSVPGDFSTATFPLVAAAVTGGEARLENLDFGDRQGDKEIFSVLEKMGAEVTREPGGVTIVRSRGRLKGMKIDLNATPDALPALAVAGCFAEGETVLANVPQARMKETDRIACMTCELRRMGADVEELRDGMVIRGSRLRGALLDGHGDHRIVMSLAIAGMMADGETVIEGAEAAAVTYPGFLPDFRAAGADIREF